MNRVPRYVDMIYFQSGGMSSVSNVQGYGFGKLVRDCVTVLSAWNRDQRCVLQLRVTHERACFSAICGMIMQ